MTVYLLGLIVPLLSFALQIWPRLIKRYFGVDTWRWLFFAEYIRKRKALPKKSPEQFIAKTPFGYPPVILIFLSLFPKKFLEKYQFIFSPFFEFLNNYFIFYIAFLLSHDLATGIIAQITSTLTPIVITEASNLNTRTLSTSVFNISFSSLILFKFSSNPFWLILSGMSLFLLFFTHRFGVQTFLVVVIGFTFLERDIFYSFYFFALFGLVYILGGKTYKAILNEHIASLMFWAGKSDLRFAHQIRGLVKKQKIEDFTQRAYNLSVKNPLLFVITSNPWAFLVIMIALFDKINFLNLSSTLSQSVIQKFEIWIVILFIWAILVLAVKRLQNFGDGQRYVGYCVFPAAMLVGSFCSPLIKGYGLLAYIFIFFVASIMIGLIIFLQYKVILRDRSRSINKGVWGIIDYINSHNPSKVRLAMFPQQMGDAILYFTKCRVLTSDTLIGLEKLADFYPVLKKPMNEIINKYKINHIYIDRNYVQIEELKLRRYKIVVDINDYVLLKIV